MSELVALFVMRPCGGVRAARVSMRDAERPDFAAAVTEAGAEARRRCGLRMTTERRQPTRWRAQGNEAARSMQTYHKSQLTISLRRISIDLHHPHEKNLADHHTPSNLGNL
ncbi:hypothetical protein [Burkholderia pseudomallei]|uniref:hypothetical protein n=1 Tax=Burkholderia pseudomallei TaxID=28450 RepID=UPI001F25C7ED|nr:hypothetical protein [Burkholderia pseudomallei]